MAAPAQASFSRSPNTSLRSYDSSSVSSATSPRQSQSFPGGFVNHSPRPTGSSASQNMNLPSLPSVSQGFQGYAQMGRDQSIPNDLLGSPAGGMGTPLAVQESGITQKRAYRQRRKDPSCDACRERKVKCDATETASCSECTSRNVKCQFTKETNRRMSSIKQVQDLEKQMDRMKKENFNLRRIVRDKEDSPGGNMDVEAAESLSFNLPQIGSEPKKRRQISPIPELARPRMHMRDFSRGIWKPPAQCRTGPLAIFRPPVPDLPPKQITNELLRAYYAIPHTMFPILHLPTFESEVEELYRSNGVSASPAWLSLFFAVIATGSLFMRESPSNSNYFRSAELIDAARKATDPWNNHYTLDDARALVLIAICLNEMNLKSTSWTWLGNAVRVAQDIGLYSESGSWPNIEGEMRRRTWWTIYIMDRHLASEMGHPFMIADEDCDTSLPAGVDDHFIREDGVMVPNGVEPLTHSLLAVIHVMRSYSALIPALAYPFIAQAQAASFDAHFAKCLATFPPTCSPSSSVALAPHFLPPLAYLLHTRLILHRHNIAPSSPAEVRSAALDICTGIALETSSLIRRLNGSLAEVATALVTTHLFRSTLLLLLAGHFEPAVACVRALSSIDARREVSIPCGRYLTFFVSVLASKRAEYSSYVQRTLSPRSYPSATQASQEQVTILQHLTRDEELIVYVSADAQASPDRAWAWRGFERETNVPRPSSFGNHAPAAGRCALFITENRLGLTAEENRDWGGWARLEANIRALPSSHLATSPQSAGSSGWTPLPPLQNIQLDTPNPGHENHRFSETARFSAGSANSGDHDRAGSPAPGRWKAGSDRLSIANII